MFQMQARTTGIPLPLTIPSYYQTKQEQHTGKQRVVQNLWEKIPQDCWAISSFSHQLNLLWKPHVFPWTDRDVLRLLQPCVSLLCLPLVLAFAGSHWAVQEKQTHQRLTPKGKSCSILASSTPWTSLWWGQRKAYKPWDGTGESRQPEWRLINLSDSELAGNCCNAHAWHAYVLWQDYGFKNPGTFNSRDKDK